MRKRSINPERSVPKGLKGNGLLVVVELGGEWPGLMQADASARRVVTQHEGETPSAFADRVAASLDSLFGRGIKLTTVALAVTDVVPGALSAVYTFYAPEHAARSLGTYGILRQLQRAREEGRDHLYLGFWLDGHPKMAYKRGFRPLEYLDGSSWRPMPDA